MGSDRAENGEFREPERGGLTGREHRKYRKSPFAGRAGPIIAVLCTGGAEGDRTPDLVIANDALSHLSYGPVQCERQV